MGWIAYAVTWLTFALFWTLAGASSAGRSPLETFPYGLIAMGSAAVMGVAVWRLTDRVPPDWRSPSFLATHAIAMVLYCLLYATSWMWLDVAAGRGAMALEELRSSPVLLWNLLMGSWLYLMVAGVSYAVRAQRRLRAQEAAAVEARLHAQQAQLAALRAQINPHFLFNALHSVGALVSIDPGLADRALEQLGDLLRYALGGEDEVPFRQEWAFTKDYLALEQLRLGDRLRVDEEVDAGASSVFVPPLILQPLVENAVRHGIADRPEGGCIKVRALADGKRLHLIVRDDGPGAAGSPEDGVGLTSVRRRLAALYGDSAGLTIENGLAGFSVTIDLPMRRASTWGSAT